MDIYYIKYSDHNSERDTIRIIQMRILDSRSLFLKLALMLVFFGSTMR